MALLPPIAVTRAMYCLESRPGRASTVENGLGRSLTVNVRESRRSTNKPGVLMQKSYVSTMVNDGFACCSGPSAAVPAVERHQLW